MESFKISLKAARVNAEMTQAEAAKAIGVDPATVANWENYKTGPTINQASRISEVYKVPLDNISFYRKNPL